MGMDWDQVADAVLHNPVVDNFDTLVERMEVEQDFDDLHTEEGSHCPLEPFGLARYCQIPYELAAPLEGHHDHLDCY